MPKKKSDKPKENRTPEGEPTRMGRPRKPFSVVELEKLLFLQCTESECASWFGFAVDTLARKTKEATGMTFKEFSKEKREGGKISHRRRMWQQAESSIPMSIFLAKNHLGMADKVEHGGPDGKPLETISKIVLVGVTKENLNDD